MGREKIGSFNEYCKEQRKIKLLKENINIEIDWWDECISKVMKCLKEETQNYFTWENIISYVKTKFSILGRDIPGYEDQMLLEHIKDLVFYFYGDSYCIVKGISDDSIQIHSKGVVVQELANTILEKVREKTQREDVPQERPDVDLVQALECDEQRLVKPFKEYSKEDKE